ncbi:MAG: hypothetical protein Q8O42_02100 [Acidobacteriota bacterium]|nr:hypothetical protein [Acidobacteriota bacterium]
MGHALRALGSGLRTVITAPALLMVVTAVSVLSVLPFGLVLGSQLRVALANRQPVYLGTAEIDAEWWMAFREHAEGLAATFTPAILGAAAPLDNLSAMLDGTGRPLAILGPVLLSALVWAWLWGGLLERFHSARRRGVRAFWQAGWRHVWTFVAISLAAAVAHLVLYFTVHALLFGPVFGWLASVAETERTAFFWRIALYGVFGAFLLAVSMMADFARVSVVVQSRRGVRQALTAAATFLREHAGSAITLYLLVGVLFAAMLALYVAGEVYGGTRLGGWRSILIGQGYIVARLAIRLTLAAAGVKLYAALQPGIPHHYIPAAVSSGRV